MLGSWPPGKENVSHTCSQQHNYRQQYHVKIYNARNITFAVPLMMPSSTSCSCKSDCYHKQINTNEIPHRTVMNLLCNAPRDDRLNLPYFDCACSHQIQFIKNPPTSNVAILSCDSSASASTDERLACSPVRKYRGHMPIKSYQYNVHIACMILFIHDMIHFTSRTS